ncbi:MAG: ATP-binding protein, partial [Nitrospirota bacterium]|nr:ATP-binding protein [Nitrospirota bacterium]
EAYRNDTLRKHAEAELRVHARELTALVESSGMISSIPPDKNLFEAICMVSIKKFGVKEAWVCLTDNKGSDIRPASCLGFGPDLITGPTDERKGPSCCVNPANTAVKTRTAQVMHDIQNDPDCGQMTEEALKNGHRSLMAIPLIDSENRVIGALCLYSGEPGYFSDKRINLLQIFANYVSIAIENRRLIEGLEDKVTERTAELEDFGHRLHKLYELSFASRTSAREFANMILHELGGLLDVDGAALGIFEHNTWVGYAVTDRSGLGLTEGMTFPADEVFCKIVSDSRRPLVIKDASVSDEYREHPDFIKYGFSSYLGVPVFIEENMFGVLCTFSRSPYNYREHDLILHQLISKRLEFEFIREKYINDIRDAMVQAESASRAKSDFLANMSHELRTPLNSIIGFSEMMFDGMTGPITEKQRDFLDTVISSGRHLLALINDILDLSKIEAGKMDLELNEFDLKRFLESCLEMFRKKIIKHNIKTGVSLEEGIGTITADERKIKQVVFNLVSNALKFTADGGSVSISARIVRNAAAPEGPAEAAGFNEIEVIVEDTGIGISEEGIKRLFRPFEQLENAYIKKYEGTGLGLALCKKIIELHGGTILVKSEPGKGSAFSFVLPVRTKNLTITDRLLAVRETVNPVTHLLTWEYFLRHMERVSSLHSRAGKRYGLLYFEMDSGARSEDIIAVAGLLKKTIRKHEIVSHGRNPKSFCVILFNADRAMIGNALSRIGESLQQGGYTFNIKSALFMEDGETVEEMLKTVEKDRK